MQRYFTNQIDQTKATIQKEDHHHIKNVMRFNVGDKVSICDFKGQCYEGTFDVISEEIVVSLQNKLPSTELPLQVTVAQALIRRERFEYMLQKATELGMTSLIPINTKYSIVDLEKKKEEKKLARWQKIVQEASEQSRRNMVPEIEKVTNLKELDLTVYDAVFVAYEQSLQSNTLKTVLQKHQYKHILLIVGPEGGFHQHEIDHLTNANNVYIIGLGKRILRSETASLYFLSAISYQYELGDQ